MLCHLNSWKDSGGSTMVEQSPEQPEVKGLSPPGTAGTRRENDKRNSFEKI
jgi:hypothetical protein